MKFHITKAIIIGSEAYHMIMRNALAPWTAGFQHKGMSFRPATLQGRLPMIRMGRATITEAVRNQTLTILNDAWNKAAAMDSYRAANPDWQLSMGADGDQFVQLSGNASSLLGAATKVRQALQSADPAAWGATQEELTDANTWASTINAMYGLMSKHSESLRVPSPGVPSPVGGAIAPAAAKTDYTIPIVVGAGALALLGIFLLKGRGDSEPESA